MRKIVVSLVALLTVSGLLLEFAGALALAPGLRTLLSIVHIWGGLFFIVLFPLYAWDHISANRGWLRVWGSVTGSGVLQTAAAALLILSGVVLYIYGLEAWPNARRLHHAFTYVLAVSLLLHYFSPKQPRG